MFGSKRSKVHDNPGIIRGAAMFFIVMLLVGISVPVTSQDPDDPMGMPPMDQEKIELSPETETTLSAAVKGHNRNPVIARDAVQSYIVAWEHSDDGVDSSHDIVISSATRWGANFSQPGIAELGRPGTDKSELSVAIDGDTNRYFLGWEDRAAHGRRSVFLAVSLDKCASFFRVSEVTSEFINASNPRIDTASGGKVYVAFLGWHNDSLSMQIHVCYTDDDGFSFSVPVLLSDPALGECLSPGIYVDDQYVYCTWECADRVYFTRCELDGMDFETVKKVDSLDEPSLPHPYGGPYTVEEPGIFGDGDGNLYVLWSDNREGENIQWLFWAQSFDQGVYFFKKVYPPGMHNLRTEQSDGVIDFAPDGDMYLAYGNANSIYLLRANAGETAFAQDAAVKEGEKKKGAPVIAASDLGSYVVYDMEGSSSDRRDIIITKVLEKEIIDPPENGADSPEKTFFEKYGKWMIPLFILATLIIVLIISKRGGKTTAGIREGANEGSLSKEDTSNKRKKGKGRGHDRSFDSYDENVLRGELEEKRTALELLKEERCAGNISKGEYVRMRRGYLRRVREIEGELKAK